MQRYGNGTDSPQRDANLAWLNPCLLFTTLFLVIPAFL